MTFEEFFKILDQMDALSDTDFFALYSVIHIRAMHRRLHPRSPPKSPPEGELKDCHPNGKGQGAAPETGRPVVRQTFRAPPG